VSLGTAPLVTQTCTTGTPPTQTGGTIADGTYYIISSANYDCGDTGPESSISEVAVVTGGCIQIAVGFPDGDAGVMTFTTSSQWTYSGNTITSTQVCPSNTVPSGSTTYTVNGSTVTTFENNVLNTLMKQ
jgi:hypothetical protein